jgi:hypothetical protein
MAEIFLHGFSDPSRIPVFPDSLVSNMPFYHDYSFSNAGCRNCRSIVVLFQTLQIVKYGNCAQRCVQISCKSS